MLNYKMYQLCLAIFLAVLKLSAPGSATTTTEHFTTEGHLTIPPEWNITAETIKARIIPDVISEAPQWAVKVRYGFDGVNFGNHLNRLQIKKLPTFINWNKSPGRFYTLIMTGPDTPTIEEPVNREFQHWIVTNIPARISGINEGETLTEYKVELTHLYAGGDHRIVYLMYVQPTKEKLMFNEHRIHIGSDDTLRTKFSAKAFAKKYNLTIIGANFMTLDFQRFEPIPDYPMHAPECMPDKLVPIDV